MWPRGSAVGPDLWDIATLRTDILSQFGARIDGDLSQLTKLELTDRIFDRLQQKYQEKEDLVGPDVMRQTERIVMLQVIDNQWKDHLLSMDELKQGIGNRAYGQKDPLVEYKKQSFDLFQEMLDRIDTATIRSLFNLQIVSEEPPEAIRVRQPRRPPQLTFTGPNSGAAAAGEEAGKIKTVTRDQPKVGRNELCPCGSGKKYKKCHGT